MRPTGDDGGLRRERGARLVDLVRRALREDPHWVLVPFPERADLEKLLDGLADHLMSHEGFADASIIAISERERHLWPKRRVRIWSLDGHLRAYG